MLDAGGVEAIGFLFVLLAIEVEKFHLHARRPFDVLVDFRDRQAAFLVNGHFLRGPGDFRIDEDPRFRLAFFLGDIHGHDAFGDADLDRREPNSRRVVHGLKHVLDQLADFRRDLADRGRFGAQFGVGEDDERSQWHAPHVSNSACGINAIWSRSPFVRIA